MKFALLLLLAGCASTMTAEDVEWRRQIDRENWQLCDSIYKQFDKPTFHRHLHRRNVEPRWYEIRDDLSDNACRAILGDYWIDY